MASKFHMPVRIVTGDGALEGLGQVAVGLGRRALVVCGRSAARAGSLDRALGSLRGAGVQAQVFDAVRGEPTLETLGGAITALRSLEAEVVVGLGGGSAMDVAKAAAGLARAEGDLREYFGGRAPDCPALPWVAIPTTSGTGAEVTMNAVLTDEATQVKQSMRSDSWYAHTALVDPTTTVSGPLEVTAHSGADALTQAIEAFTSIAAMPMTDALCRDAIRLIGRSLVRAVRDGQDLPARRDMAYGSMMAGVALANARLGAVHGMAHPLGSRHHLAHGLVCGLLLPYVMEWNLGVAQEKYAGVAQLVGAAEPGAPSDVAAQAALGWVRRLMAEVGIPATLGEAGATGLDATALARESMSSSMAHNPRPTTVEEVAQLIERAR